jgi:hypothetical protein
VNSSGSGRAVSVLQLNGEEKRWAGSQAVTSPSRRLRFDGG